MQLTFREVKKNIHQFDHGLSTMEYVETQKIKASKYAAKFMEVYLVDDMSINYFSERPLWVLLPKKIAKKTNHICLMKDGTIEAETKERKVLFKSTNKVDERKVTSEIMFLGVRN